MNRWAHEFECGIIMPHTCFEIHCPHHYYYYLLIRVFPISVS